MQSLNTIKLNCYIRNRSIRIILTFLSLILREVQDTISHDLSYEQVQQITAALFRWLFPIRLKHIYCNRSANPMSSIAKRNIPRQLECLTGK